MNKFILQHGSRILDFLKQTLLILWWLGATWVFLSDTWYGVPSVLHDRPFQLIMLFTIWAAYRVYLRSYKGKKKDLIFYVKLFFPTLCLCSLIYYLIQHYL